MSDRVVERRRAAQLARHYRDQENLTIAEIARRLGRAPPTVKAYLYHPSQANKRPADSPQERTVLGACWSCTDVDLQAAPSALAATARGRRSRLRDLSESKRALCGNGPQITVGLQRSSRPADR